MYETFTGMLPACYTMSGLVPRLMERFGLAQLIVIRRKPDRDKTMIVVAPYFEGLEDKREELANRGIPFWFLVLLKLRYPWTRLIVRESLTFKQVKELEPEHGYLWYAAIPLR